MYSPFIKLFTGGCYMKNGEANLNIWTVYKHTNKIN